HDALPIFELVVFLAHEQQRGLRRQQQQGGSYHASARRYKVRQSLALGAVANLIMVLNADYMRRQAHVLGGHAARTSVPELKWLAPKAKPCIQGPRNLLRLAQILVIALALAGKER